MLRNSVDPSFSGGAACSGTGTLRLEGGQHPPECQQIVVEITCVNPLNSFRLAGVSMLRNIHTRFTSSINGMGSFSIRPQKGKKYSATIIYENGQIEKVDLPSSSISGTSLSVNNSSRDTLSVRISNLNPGSNKSVVLVAHRDEKIYYTTRATLDFPVQLAVLSKDRLPAGIVQFSLLNENGEYLNRRLVFVKHDVKLDVKLRHKLINSSLNTIKFDSYKNNKKASFGSFSVLISPGDSLTSAGEDFNTIQSNLLLSSELKGMLEDANYYLIHANENNNVDLDNLMLTQAYSEFILKDIRNPSTTKFEPEFGLKLTGVVTRNSGKIASNVPVQLLSTEVNIFLDTLTDNKGRFSFNNLQIDSITQLIIKVKDNYFVKIDSTELPPVEDFETLFQGQLLSLDDRITRKYDIKGEVLLKTDSVRNSRTLEEVRVTAKKIIPGLERSSNILGPGKADQVIMGDNLRGCISLADCLAGKLNFITITTGGAAINNRRPISLGGLQPMQIFVDGLPVGPAGLAIMNANDVYSIEVLRSGKNLAIYGSQASNGAILITTRRGGEKQQMYSQTINGLVYSYNGYHKGNSFPPTYLAELDKQSRGEPKTVYWNPNLITDENGKASFDFPYKEGEGDYQITIEGIDLEGNLYFFQQRLRH